MKKVVIVEAARTAMGRLGGALRDVECDQLAAVIVEECIRKTELPSDMISEVIMGQFKMTTDTANFARVAALLAGIPVEVPAYSIMRQCGSSLETINCDVRQIMVGQADLYLGWC